MKTPLSPNDIEVLIWCHCRPAPHERIEAPAVYESICMWREAGMIEERDLENVFYTTPKGRAMIEALCSTKEPREAFIDENGRVLLAEVPTL